MNPVYPVFFVTGLVLCVLGLLVWKKQMVSIIAGYDPRKVLDPAGLARWVGRNVFLMGAAVMALALIGFALHLISALTGIYIVVLLVGSIITVAGSRRYER